MPCRPLSAVELARASRPPRQHRSAVAVCRSRASRLRVSLTSSARPPAPAALQRSSPTGRAARAARARARARIRTKTRARARTRTRAPTPRSLIRGARCEGRSGRSPPERAGAGRALRISVDSSKRSTLLSQPPPSPVAGQGQEQGEEGRGRAVHARLVPRRLRLLQPRPLHGLRARDRRLPRYLSRQARRLQPLVSTARRRRLVGAAGPAALAGARQLACPPALHGAWRCVPPALPHIHILPPCPRARLRQPRRVLPPVLRRRRQVPLVPAGLRPRGQALRALQRPSPHPVAPRRVQVSPCFVPAALLAAGSAAAAAGASMRACRAAQCGCRLLPRADLLPSLPPSQVHRGVRVGQGGGRVPGRDRGARGQPGRRQRRRRRRQRRAQQRVRAAQSAGPPARSPRAASRACPPLCPRPSVPNGAPPPAMTDCLAGTRAPTTTTATRTTATTMTTSWDERAGCPAVGNRLSN